MTTAEARPAKATGWRGRLAVWAALLLCACSSIPVADYGAAASAARPARTELGDVPFYPQEQYQCGPAALATALGSAGAPRTPQELQPEVYLPQRQGSLQPEMLAASRRAGVLPYVLEPSPETLLQEVAAGHPVVVLQNLGLAVLPQWHYAVVVGYDLPAGQIMLRSGRERRLVMRSADFDRSWARAGRWAFVALPPERLPASARSEDFVTAAAALERVSPDAAGRAYRTALAAWPGNMIAQIGLGNVAYRRHDLEAAESAYRGALADHPDAADAWNNLAQVLHELGRRPEAQAAARQAVAIGGPRLKTYEATLAAITADSPRAGH